ncbi:MAG: hypothetical protein WCO60_18295 [Verrucomicrobiota bacterium]
MANVVAPTIPKTNATPGSTSAPPAGSLATGELATNKFLGRAYLKKEDGTVADVAPLKSVNSKSIDANGNSVLAAADVGAVPTTDKGAANGVATLDGTGKVPVSQLPASVIGGLNYQGTWNASTNTPALVSGTGTKGFYYKVSTAGSTTIDGVNAWYVGDFIAFNGTTWDKIDGVSSEVLKVNNVSPGVGGNVTLTATDVAAVPSSEKGANSGVATLDAGGKVPATQMPIATASAVGGVKQGSGISIAGDGTISATGSMGVASSTTLGGVKPAASDFGVDGTGVLTLAAAVLRSTDTITGGTY